MVLTILASRRIDAGLRLLMIGPWWRVMAQNEQLPEQPRTMVSEWQIMR
jgi:hypothetical protein